MQEIAFANFDCIGNIYLVVKAKAHTAVCILRGCNIRRLNVVLGVLDK
jgi:hypothetical protein